MRLLLVCITIALGLLGPQLCWAVLATHLVISEVAVNLGGASNEWVELYNPTSSAIDLKPSDGVTAGAVSLGADLRLHIVSSTGSDTSKTLTWVNQVIPAYGFLLIASSAYSGVTADATYSAGLVGNGAVYLSTSSTADTEVIDSLDYGADQAGVGEGTAVANIENDQSLERRSAAGTHDTSRGNGEDSDDNSADWQTLATPDPQNSSSAAEDPNPPAADTTAPTTAASPAGSSFRTGQTVTLTTNEAATIYYSLDGSEPTIASATYSEPLTITTATTLKFFARDTAGNSEAIKTESYSFDTTPPAAATNLGAIAGNGLVDLSWVNPADADLAGVLILRSTSTITDSPTAGTSYSAGDSLGSSTVLYSGAAASTTGSGLANGTTYFFQIWTWDTLRNYSAGVEISATPVPVQLWINELQSSPSSGSEWIELWNPNAWAVSLASFQLRDGAGTFETIAAGQSIAAGGYWVHELSSSRLNNSGDLVELRDASGTLLDSVTYGDWTGATVSAPSSGESLARRADGAAQIFVVASPTKNAANPAPPVAAASVQLLLTEVDYAAAGSSTDSIEILVVDDGQGGAGVDLEGFTLSDDSVFKTIAAGTRVATGDYILLGLNSATADETSATSGVLRLYSTHSGLVSTSEQVVLRDGYGTVEDAIAWESESPTESETTDLTELVSEGGWIGAAWDSGDLSTGQSLHRIRTGAGYTETSTESDWFARSPTLGSATPLNQNPSAVLTIQGSGATSGCNSLFVNLTGESSTDPDGETLSFSWNFGNGTTSAESNPAGFYLSVGSYTVTLTVTDPLGATGTASQVFQVNGCSSGGGGGSTSSSTQAAEQPKIDSLPANKIRLVINEISLNNSAADWVELLLLDDGAAGAGVDLGGFYFESDRNLKTIPRGTRVRSGEFLLLYFKSEKADEPGNRQLYTAASGLTKTDEQLTVRDSTGAIVDAVVWADQSGEWSRGEAADTAELVGKGAWIGTEEVSAFDSRLLARDYSLARHSCAIANQNQGTSCALDTNTKADWYATPRGSPAAVNQPPPKTAAELPLQLTAVGFKNSGGDTLVIECPSCAQPAELADFFVKFGADKVVDLPAISLPVGTRLTLKFGAEAEKFDQLQQVFYSTHRGLSGTDGLVSLKDFADTTTDFVCWTDRTNPPSRDYDLSLAETQQLEKRARENHWHSDQPGSCLDSRTVPLGGGIQRIAGKSDTNTILDWEVVESATPLLAITPQLSDAIKLSEILPDPVGPDAGVEWLELVNTGTIPVQLFGWQLVASGSNAFVFEESWILAPGEYRALPGVLSLSNSGKRIQLLDYTGATMDEVTYPALDTGKSYALLPTGWSTTDLPTPDKANSKVRILKLSEDRDRDSLSDAEEKALGTNPGKFDTDGDGLPDGFELSRGLDPLRAGAMDQELIQAYRAELTNLVSSQAKGVSDEKVGLQVAGVGLPGGTVRLYIHSQVRMVELPVDDSGHWSYTLDLDLEAGEHKALVQLLDPAGFASAVTKVLDFALPQGWIAPRYSETVRLSELMPNPDGVDKENEWIELENFGHESVDLSGWQLAAGDQQWQLPAGTSLAAGELRIFSNPETKLTLKNSNSQVALLWPNGKTSSEIEYAKTKSGVALAWGGREWLETTTPTPGARNQITAPKTHGKKAGAKYRNGTLSELVKISEILANPIGSDTRAEFIELVNLGKTAVNLGNWQLSEGGGKMYRIPDSVVLAPGQVRSFLRSTTKLALNNSSDRVELLDWRGVRQDLVSYAVAAEGVSLARDGEQLRPTRLPTPGLGNAFDTQLLTGQIEWVGETSLVLRNELGEHLIRFAATGSELTRALLRVGTSWQIYAQLVNGEWILDSFEPVAGSGTTPIQIASALSNPLLPVGLALLLFALAWAGVWRLEEVQIRS